MTNQRKLALVIALLVLAAGAFVWGVMRIRSTEVDINVLASDKTKAEIDQREHDELMAMPAAQFNAAVEEANSTMSLLRKMKALDSDIDFAQRRIDLLESIKKLRINAK